MDKEIKKAAKQGDVNAQAKLGKYFYLKGKSKKTELWLSLAAEKGHLEAGYLLGNHYAIKYNYPMSYENPQTWKALAIRWLTRVAQSESCPYVSGTINIENARKKLLRVWYSALVACYYKARMEEN